MLSSIHPLGERGKNNRFSVTASWFVVGSIVGGALTGTVVATLGIVVDALLSTTVAVAATVALCVAGAVVEWRGLALPCLHRQVDEEWLGRYRGWVYGAGYGVQLGAGITTYITSAGVYVAIGAALFVGHPLASVAIMTVFGLARGLSIVPAGAIDSPGRLVAFHQRLQRTASAAQRVAWVSLAVVAVAAPAVFGS